MQLGQAIVQIRKERGLTQEAFAKMYSVTRQTSLDKGTQRKTTENELPSLTQCTA